MGTWSIRSGTASTLSGLDLTVCSQTLTIDETDIISPQVCRLLAKLSAGRFLNLEATPLGICSRLGVFASTASRLPYSLERCRPRHPHPKGSHGRVREAEVACLSSVFSDLRCRKSILYQGAAGCAGSLGDLRRPSVLLKKFFLRRSRDRIE